MEKSKAILIIAESLVEPRYDDVEKEAEHILNRLVRAGMLPPSLESGIKYDVVNQAFIPWFKNEWELEDEN